MKRTLFRNVSTVLTCAGAMKKQGRHVVESDLSLQHNQSVLVTDGRIEWIGPHQKLPKKLKIHREIDGRSYQMYPGFVECHTHLGFAGHRADEFELRLNGVSYQEINQRGGGIQSTVKKTRKINAADLLKITQQRAMQFLQQGVTTLEAKSGYGLDLKTEMKLLEVYGKIKGPQVIKTYLGPHSLPREFSSHDDYMNFICEEMLPKLHKKKCADRVDIFIEKGFFTSEQGARYFTKARELGFDLVVHADQLSLSGGAALAVKYAAHSADHVIEVGADEIRKLSDSEVTCVLLPIADFYMRCAYPKARQMIEEGARVAIATDFNPGSAPSKNLNFAGILARLEMKMTLPEVIAAYTVGPSFALNKQNLIGSLEVGKSADFVLSRQDWTELFYSVDASEFDQVYVRGARAYSAMRNKI